jgi:hypothetical protein
MDVIGTRSSPQTLSTILPAAGKSCQWLQACLARRKQDCGAAAAAASRRATNLEDLDLGDEVGRVVLHQPEHACGRVRAKVSRLRTAELGTSCVG